jgi:hypothetical protein
MQDDYAKAAASPRTVTIGEVAYKVSKFGPRDLGDLQAWLKSQIPDPRLMAKELCAGLSDAVALEIWRDLSQEAQDWPPTITSQEGNRLLMVTHEGNAQVLLVALRRHQAGFNIEQARKIAETISLDEITSVLNAGFPEPTFDPKDPAESTTPPT